MTSVLFKSFSFVLIIFLTYYLKRIGFFEEKDSDVVSKILINITLPAAIIHSFQGFSKDIPFLPIILLGFFCCLLPMLFAAFFTRKTPASLRSYMLITAGGFNIGCFALPFVQNFFDAKSAAITCIFDIGNALLVTGGSYTIASSLLHIDKEKITPVTIIKKLTRSVSFDTYLLLLLLTAFGLSIPSGLDTLITPIASANGFVAMALTGLLLELKIDREKYKPLLAVLLLRLIFAGMFSCFFYFFLPFPFYIRQTLAVVAFAPSSALAPVFVEKCHGDSALSSLTASITILCSIFIMTLFILGMKSF